MPILCEIVTQEKLVYSDQVDMVVLDGEEGRMGILPNHSPLLTTLQVSEIRVKKRSAGGDLRGGRRRLGCAARLRDRAG